MINKAFPKLALLNPFEAIMAIAHAELEEILRQAFPNANIDLVDMAGDEDHYQLNIVDESFQGLTVINKHRLVKQALSNVLESRLHAITINASAPS